MFGEICPEGCVTDDLWDFSRGKSYTKSCLTYSVDLVMIITLLYLNLAAKAVIVLTDNLCIKF